jgi:hypothetical protein
MDDGAVEALIQAHVQRYPEADILDVYKLLHQGVFGPGHAITNQRAARDWLERESATLRPQPGDSLVENIHPAGKMVRLHLRPYLQAQGDLRKLLDGFLRSSREVQGDLAQMAAWWALFQRLTEEGGALAARFANRTVALVGRTRAAEKWPASHHSPAFERAYHPAYRVLTASIAQEILGAQRMPFTPV